MLFYVCFAPCAKLNVWNEWKLTDEWTRMWDAAYMPKFFLFFFLPLHFLLLDLLLILIDIHHLLLLFHLMFFIWQVHCKPLDLLRPIWKRFTSQPTCLLQCVCCTAVSVISSAYLLLTLSSLNHTLPTGHHIQREIILHLLMELRSQLLASSTSTSLKSRSLAPSGKGGYHYLLILNKKRDTKTNNTENVHGKHKNQTVQIFWWNLQT